MEALSRQLLILVSPVQSSDCCLPRRGIREGTNPWCYESVSGFHKLARVHVRVFLRRSTGRCKEHYRQLADIQVTVVILLVDRSTYFHN